MCISPEQSTTPTALAQLRFMSFALSVLFFQEVVFQTSSVVQTPEGARGPTSQLVYDLVSDPLLTVQTV